MMRREGGGELLETLMVRLYEIAERPPREVKGVSDEFLAGEWDTRWAYGDSLHYAELGLRLKDLWCLCKIGTLTRT